MASDVDICNLALAHLGDEAQVAAIVPPDGSIQSAHCARYYPLVRSALLEMHPWPFAVKRMAIASVDNPIEDDWAYAYSLPSTCIRPLSLLVPGASPLLLSNETDAGSYPYLLEAAEDGSKVLYTNAEGAYLRYIDLVTDPTKYTPLFVLAFARLLASQLAGPILKGDTGMKVAAAQLKIFAEVDFPKAAVASANTGKRDTRRAFVPSWLAARGLASPIPDAPVQE